MAREPLYGIRRDGREDCERKKKKIMPIDALNALASEIDSRASTSGEEKERQMGANSDEHGPQQS